MFVVKCMKPSAQQHEALWNAVGLNHSDNTTLKIFSFFSVNHPDYPEIQTTAAYV